MLPFLVNARNSAYDGLINAMHAVDADPLADVDAPVLKKPRYELFEGVSQIINVDLPAIGDVPPYTMRVLSQQNRGHNAGEAS